MVNWDSDKRKDFIYQQLKLTVYNFYFLEHSYSQLMQEGGMEFSSTRGYFLDHPKALLEAALLRDVYGHQNHLF